LKEQGKIHKRDKILNFFEKEGPEKKRKQHTVLTCSDTARITQIERQHFKLDAKCKDAKDVS
jgi:hypothetical protein